MVNKLEIWSSEYCMLYFIFNLTDCKRMQECNSIILVQKWCHFVIFTCIYVSCSRSLKFLTNLFWIKHVCEVVTLVSLLVQMKYNTICLNTNCPLLIMLFWNLLWKHTWKKRNITRNNKFYTCTQTSIKFPNVCSLINS